MYLHFFKLYEMPKFATLTCSGEMMSPQLHRDRLFGATFIMIKLVLYYVGSDVQDIIVAIQVVIV